MRFSNIFIIFLNYWMKNLAQLKLQIEPINIFHNFAKNKQNIPDCFFAFFKVSVWIFTSLRVCVCGCLCENAMVCVRATLAPSQINRMRLKFYTNSFRSVRFALLCFICRAISTFSLFVFHFFFFISSLKLRCFWFFYGGMASVKWVVVYSSWACVRKICICSVTLLFTL